MPISSNYGKLYTALMINKLNEYHSIDSILDVGAGDGAYYNLLSPYLENVKWSGIEVWEPYCIKYDLQNKYEILLNQDVRNINFAKGPLYDIILFGDIIEHMTKQEAQSIISNALPKTQLIMISIPIIHFPQDEVDGNPFEIHVKDDWSHDEVLESFPYITSAFIHEFIGVYFLASNSVVSKKIRRIQSLVSNLVKESLPYESIAWA